MRLPLLPSRKQSWRRRMLEYAVAIPLIYAVYLTAVYFKQDSILFATSFRPVPRPAGQLPPGVESWWIDAGTPERPIKVEAWYLPPPGASADAKAPAVILFHGNAELIDTAFDSARGWRSRGYALLLPEYRGYGRSGGQPSQTGLTADAIRFYDLLAARPEIAASRIVFHGRSVGGGVAAQLAAARAPAAMVLESTFTSVASLTWKFGAPPFLAKHPFRTDRILPGLGRPVLLLHGRDDEIIPVAHSRRLHETTPGSAFVELPGTHNNFPIDQESYRAAIDIFLASNGLPTEP